MRLRIYYPVFATAVLVVALHVVLAATGATYYMTQARVDRRVDCARRRIPTEHSLDRGL